MKMPPLLTHFIKWYTVNQNKHITKSLGYLICIPLTSINHFEQTRQKRPSLHQSLLLLQRLYMKSYGGFGEGADVLPNDQLIIQAVK